MPFRHVDFSINGTLVCPFYCHFLIFRLMTYSHFARHSPQFRWQLGLGSREFEPLRKMGSIIGFVTFKYFGKSKI